MTGPSQKKGREDPLDLTVVVCSYNAGHMIRDCLTAVRENNPRQVVLVDGGSTDDTRSIAEEYVDLTVDDGARGLANARNRGIDQAVGKYICFVGPDNVMPEGSLRAMMSYLRERGCAIDQPRNLAKSVTVE